MEGTCGSFGTTLKQFEHVPGLRDDTGDNGVGDNNVVEEKKEIMLPHYPLSVYL